MNRRQQKNDNRREGIAMRNREITKATWAKPRRGFDYGPCSIVSQVSQSINAAVEAGRTDYRHSVY